MVVGFLSDTCRSNTCRSTSCSPNHCSCPSFAFSSSRLQHHCFLAPNLFRTYGSSMDWVPWPSSSFAGRNQYCPLLLQLLPFLSPPPYASSPPGPSLLQLQPSPSLPWWPIHLQTPSCSVPVTWSVVVMQPRVPRGAARPATGEAEEHMVTHAVHPITPRLGFRSNIRADCCHRLSKGECHRQAHQATTMIRLLLLLHHLSHRRPCSCFYSSFRVWYSVL
mmetsp:Transcript_4836/g.11519  ORF Transcript_4836/g.11519 Transcript_4836/m.11519 type:complete len:220 (+) Transcript_4836:34-693(+)